MLSVIIPAYNEEKCIKRVHSEIHSLLVENNIESEFIFVDDGSQDQTYKMINELSLEEENIIGLHFSRNFGKGYASFGDLTELDIDIVKIDKSITQNATSPNGFLVLKNIVRTAKELGFKTLCEGIETEEHKKIAVEAGCDMLQGYYFYRPMAITQFEKLFEEQQGDFYVISNNSCV